MTDPTQELLALLGKQIEEEEMKVRERVDRIAQYDDPGIEDAIRDEWHRFHLSIKPLQEQREYIIKQLVTIEAANRPAPIVLPRT
jgi:hypothetical protein